MEGAEANVELVVVPLDCSLSYRIEQPRGWRNDKYESSYARPVSHTAFATFHVQIWNRNGVLLSERVGKSAAKKPLLYDLVGRRKKEPGEGVDVARDARRFYGAPMLRTLYKAVKIALRSG